MDDVTNILHTKFTCELTRIENPNEQQLGRKPARLNTSPDMQAKMGPSIASKVIEREKTRMIEREQSGKREREGWRESKIKKIVPLSEENSLMSFVSQTVAGLSQTRSREDPPPRQHCSHQHAHRHTQLSRKNSLPEWDPPEQRTRKNSLPADILDRMTESTISTISEE
uniref:SFRICE_017070 n=1 Tax=Spodoptera frugiperda TaxID=7108 RepID=A0A2H1V5K5_SPOFR